MTQPETQGRQAPTQGGAGAVGAACGQALTASTRCSATASNPLPSNRWPHWRHESCTFQKMKPCPPLERRVGPEELAHLVDLGPPPEPQHPPDDLDVGPVAGRQ